MMVLLIVVYNAQIRHIVRNDAHCSHLCRKEYRVQQPLLEIPLDPAYLSGSLEFDAQAAVEDTVDLLQNYKAELT